MEEQPYRLEPHYKKKYQRRKRYVLSTEGIVTNSWSQRGRATRTGNRLRWGFTPGHMTYVPHDSQPDTQLVLPITFGVKAFHQATGIPK